MDDLLREFLTESAEHLDTVDAELVRFERDPTDQAVLRNIFRLVHTIKGTCGFLGLPRLEALAHAAETLMGCFRDGAPVSAEAVTLVLATLDRLKTILNVLGTAGSEPPGEDVDLIGALESMANAQVGTSEAKRSRRSGRRRRKAPRRTRRANWRHPWTAGGGLPRRARPRCAGTGGQGRGGGSRDAAD